MPAVLLRLFCPHRSPPALLARAPGTLSPAPLHPPHLSSTRRPPPFRSRVNSTCITRIGDARTRRDGARRGGESAARDGLSAAARARRPPRPSPLPSPPGPTRGAGGEGNPTARGNGLPVLDEANLVGALAEALAADVHAVLADEGALVAADAAARGKGERRGRGGTEVGGRSVGRARRRGRRPQGKRDERATALRPPSPARPPLHGSAARALGDGSRTSGVHPCRSWGASSR